MGRKSKKLKNKHKTKRIKYKRVRNTKRRTRRNRKRGGGFDTIMTTYRFIKEKLHNYRNKSSNREVVDFDIKNNSSNINDQTGKLRDLGNKTEELKDNSGNFAEMTRKMREAEEKANEPWYRNLF